MRYTVQTVELGYNTGPYAKAGVVVTATSEALALRHARAIAAVIRAAKAESAARHRANALVGCGDRYTLADQRHTRSWARYVDATARLVAVEKEVKRG
jgi:hypothetical protein